MDSIQAAIGVARQAARAEPPDSAPLQAWGLLSGTSPLPRVCRLGSWPDSISVAVGFRHILAVDETHQLPSCSCCPSYTLGSLANKHWIRIYRVIVDRRAKELVPSRDE